MKRYMLTNTFDRPYDDKLQKSFERVTDELKEMGLFEYSTLHLLWRNIELFSFLFLGAWSATTGSVLGWWFGALCGGIFMQRAGWFQVIPSCLCSFILHYPPFE